MIYFIFNYSIIVHIRVDIHKIIFYFKFNICKVIHDQIIFYHLTNINILFSIIILYFIQPLSSIFLFLNRLFQLEIQNFFILFIFYSSIIIYFLVKIKYMCLMDCLPKNFILHQIIKNFSFYYFKTFKC